MGDNKIFVGIDVSKDRLDIAERPTGESWSVNNDNQGIEELVQRMKELQPERIVLEATGGLEVLVSNALSSENLPVIVMNPRLIRNFAKSTGRLAKTDSLDADILAHYGEAIKPKVRQISEPEAQELKALLRRRKQIVKMIASEKSRLYSAPEWVQYDIKENIAWLENRLTNIDNRLTEKTKLNTEWKEKDEIFQSVGGIGPVISRSILVDLPEIGHVNNKKIAALAGVAPFNNDSGTWKGKRVVWGGRSGVRSALYMGTLSATQHNPVIKKFYERLIKAGKAKKVAITACMRKLLTILNSMAKNRTKWQPVEV